MTCESCIKDVSDSLYRLDGISKVEADLKDQLVSVKGTSMQNNPMFFFNLVREKNIFINVTLAAPSAIVAAIQGTGRDAILRGSGTAEST